MVGLYAVYKATIPLGLGGSWYVFSWGSLKMLSFSQMFFLRERVWHISPNSSQGILDTGVPMFPSSGGEQESPVWPMKGECPFVGMF